MPSTKKEINKNKTHQLPSKSMLKSKLHHLHSIQQCSKPAHNNILKHLDETSISLLCEACHNILTSRPGLLNKKKIESLRPHQKRLSYLANPKNSAVKKRKIITNQTGSGFGLIALIANAAISILSTLIGKNK